MKRKAGLAVAGILITVGLLMPSRTDATCDPSGTSYLYYEEQVCNPGAEPGCDQCPEQSFCTGGMFDPPTTCCNGYSIVYGPDEGVCYYCRDNYYVCN